VTIATLLPPWWLIHFSVAAVWLYEGLWCKLLQGEPHQLEVVEAAAQFTPASGRLFLNLLGIIESVIAFWVLSGLTPVLCASVQTLLLVILNSAGLLRASRIIHDPAGMVVKNIAFLVLAWVSASHPAWR
jgi:DoxX-like protein